MKCPRCGGTAYAYACEDENGEMPIKCPWCGYSEVQTKEEWIKSLNTEQLAEVLADISLWIHPFMKKRNRFELLKKQFREWLKEVHKE